MECGMECGHSENFLLWCQTCFLEVVKVAQKLEIHCLDHSSAMEDVVRVMLWRTMLNEVWQRGAHEPNCLVSAMGTVGGDFRQPEVHSTFTSLP